MTTLTLTEAQVRDRLGVIYTHEALDDMLSIARSAGIFANAGFTLTNQSRTDIFVLEGR